MRTIASLLALSALLAACGSSSPTAPEADPFELQTVVKVSQSGYHAPLRATIRSPAEWAEAWQMLHRGLQPVPARPPIDFSREVVVIAAAGSRPNGCYSIDLVDVRPSIEGQPVFDVLELQPGPDCVCTQVVTQPAHAVRVTRFSGDAEFLERSAQLSC